MAPSRVVRDTQEYVECSVPIEGPGGQIVYFDVQPAEPGTFIIPGVIDPEDVKRNMMVEASWIYFKGDPMRGPRPGHPFDMPFDNHNTTFSIDLIEDNVKMQQIMCKSQYC